MAHTYSSLTKSDNTYTAVSDITPITGAVEDKFTWANTYPNYDTWIELGARAHWCDWYFATPWTDAWDSLTTPDYTYITVSPIYSDNFINTSIWSYWLSINVLTWNNAYAIGKIKWSDWVEVETEYNYQSLTTPTQTYREVTV